MRIKRFIMELEPKEKQIDVGQTLGAFVWDLVKVLVISMVIIVPIKYYVAQPFIVSGSSMVPTFRDGEYLIIDQLSYRTSEPQRGDIVVFKYPKDNTQYFIKRIVGLPGEKVTIRDTKVYITNQENPKGFELKEEYLSSGSMTLGVNENNVVSLGADEYFVLGDNRAGSSDSRFWGPVPEYDLVGKVFIRAFPFTVFKSVTYNQ